MRASIGAAATPLAAAAALLAAGCIGGQVLRGYPGYPFQSFVAPAPPDTVFFRIQTLLHEAGFPLDYTRREEGLINTRRAPPPAPPLFLSVVVAAGDEDEASRVWVAGYVETYAGPQRVNPNDEDLWARVVEVSERLSAGLGGTPPRGPEGPGVPPSRAGPEARPEDERG